MMPELFMMTKMRIAQCPRVFCPRDVFFSPIPNPAVLVLSSQLKSRKKIGRTLVYINIYYETRVAGVGSRCSHTNRDTPPSPRDLMGGIHG